MEKHTSDPSTATTARCYKAAIFYAEYLDQVKTILHELNADDAAAIRVAQLIQCEEELAIEWTFIAGNWIFSALFKKLQTQYLPLQEG